ncbi:hypothetical protein GCM10022207_49280 [Streptomyces lannensis]|uniref:Uncharacterized protein n=1 Tax=Streptomyces lannensis TaxID=766498 RepID=A0ABP7KGW1_9ACTN
MSRPADRCAPPVYEGEIPDQTGGTGLGTRFATTAGDVMPKVVDGAKPGGSKQPRRDRRPREQHNRNEGRRNGVRRPSSAGLCGPCGHGPVGVVRILPVRQYEAVRGDYCGVIRSTMSGCCFSQVATASSS